MSSRSVHRRGNGPPDRFLILLCLADLVHLPAATGAFQAGGLDDLLDARQVLGQIAAVAPGRGLFAARFVIGRGLRVLLFLDFGDRRFEILEGQLPFILAQLLGLLAMHHVVQLRHQMLKAFVDLFKRSHTRGCRLQSLECRAVIGRQNGEVEVFGSSGNHAPNIP